ncbi:MAG: hypothetical protein KDK64_06815, partial [Chlamydiia bacterium]|nr:hypothetical protein [Chlamydiia bacterium]
MTEAISGESVCWEWEHKTAYSYLSYRNGETITCYAQDPLHQAICQAFELADEPSIYQSLSEAVHKKLQEKDRGILKGDCPYSGDEIIHHPFFVYTQTTSK